MFTALLFEGTIRTNFSPLLHFSGSVFRVLETHFEGEFHSLGRGGPLGRVTQRKASFLEALLMGGTGEKMEAVAFVHKPRSPLGRQNIYYLG